VQVRGGDPATDGAPTGSVTLGVEEEFHVVDRDSRELVARGPELLDLLPAGQFAAELHRSVVETNTPVCTDLDTLRDQLTGLRRRLVEVAGSLGLGVAAAGTVPLVDPDGLEVTSTSRYRQMLDDYQLLAREQLICGAQVHVGADDRDEAVAVAQRLSPHLPVLLAISASSPFWMGEDTGYASMRSLLWQRWPTAGTSGLLTSAADHDDLVAELIASGTISDPAMIYFDVRPSAHLPTLELRVPDACPEIDTVVLLAGLFRALVRKERDALAAGVPAPTTRAPLLRAAMWRAARSGLDGELVGLPGSPRPLPAAQAVTGMVESLRPYLELEGDWEQVRALTERVLADGGSATRQRREFARRGRLSDVVDLVLTQTSGGRPEPAAEGLPGGLRAGYAAASDEAIGRDGAVHPAYGDLLGVLEELGPAALRRRELARDEEQRSRGVTFGVAGDASVRLFPVDLVPRIVTAEDWAVLVRGVAQRARALDALLHDVYGERTLVAAGVVPAWVLDSAPGLRPAGALVHQPVRAHVIGMDLVRDGRGRWYVLEDNLRVPSGIAYAVQNRRLTAAVMPDLRMPPGLLPVEDTPALLRDTLRAAAPAGAHSGGPAVVLLSEGPSDSAWFEHRMLAEEMGVPLVAPADLLVEDGRVVLHRHGSRRPVDVIYLRLDEDTLVHAAAADGRPLGPPLLGAVHAGTVALANAPGNGVGDDKAVYAYVPRLIEHYLGERPLLPDVPTYLCGVPEQRWEVLARLDELVLKPVDGYGGAGITIGPYASHEELTAVRDQILAAPHRWVAQEMVALSTHPAFTGSRLVPRHVDLRVFAFVSDTVRVAPAALTRVAPEGSLVVNSSQGGGSKDTWVLAPGG
jgi:glutamate---cysteine ligase / carboxylate-amine ligase